MTNEEFKIMKDIAQIYNIKITEVEEGKGGVFYCENGIEKKMPIEEYLKGFRNLFDVSYVENQSVYSPNFNDCIAA